MYLNASAALGVTLLRALLVCAAPHTLLLALGAFLSTPGLKIGLMYRNVIIVSVCVYLALIVRAGQETSLGAGRTELSAEAGAGVTTHQGPGAGLDTRGVEP